MVSNHRLVLFTHALCRLSYPAVGPTITRSGLAGLFKIAHPRARQLLAGASEMRRPKRPRSDREARPLRRAIRLPFGGEHSFLPPGGIEARGDNP
jgi:hypothetical protein